MIVINLKNYKKGKEALKLAKTIEKYLPKSIICPSALDIETITSKTKLKIFAQHANFQEEDKTTGYNRLKELKKIGASGTLLNHSEHPLSITNIRKVMIMARKLQRLRAFRKMVRMSMMFMKENKLLFLFQG